MTIHHKWDYLFEAYKGTFYQGTSLASAKGIAKKGLIPGATAGSFGGGKRKSVSYLTGNFELAARYANQHATRQIGIKDIPVVLEIVISMPKRIARLEVDPQDHPDSAWDKEDYDSYDGWASLFSEVADYARKKWGYSVSHKIDIGMPSYDTGHVKSFNLYKHMLGNFRQIFRDKSKVDSEFANFKKAFPPDDDYGNGEIELLPGGDVRINAEYFENAHQVMYPKKLPPSAIKFAWVPENILRSRGKRMRALALSTQTYTVTRLPHEARSLLDTLKDDAFEYAYSLRDADSYQDIRGLLSTLDDRLSDWKKDDKGFSEVYEEWLVDDFKKLLKSFIRSKGTDYKKLAKEAEEIAFNVEQGTHDQWGDQDFATIEVHLAKIRASDLRKL